MLLVFSTSSKLYFFYFFIVVFSLFVLSTVFYFLSPFIFLPVSDYFSKHSSLCISIFFSPGLPDGPLPSSIGSLTKLQFLDFSGNGFTGTIPPQFSQLTQAWKLSLSSNALHGKYACYSFSFSIILHFNLFINYYYGTCFIV